MGTFIAFGYGPGISHAAAQRFAREGYTIALVGPCPGRRDVGYLPQTRG